MNIYSNGLGDQLINPVNYDIEISSYLTQEKSLFLNISENYSTIIESGCMNGRYLEEIIGLGKKYIGVDPINRYIKDGKEKYKDKIKSKKASLICDSINNIDHILKKTSNFETILIIFPFNSFGNISDITKTIEALKIVKCKFIISTYLNNDFSINVRKNYYVNSGFKTLDIRAEKDSVRFISNEGLNSVAYDFKWFKNAFSHNNISYFRLSNIGVAYSNINLL